METLLVVVIVGVVLFWAGRSFYRTMTGKNDGCGCSGACHGCACSASEEEKEEKGR